MSLMKLAPETVRLRRVAKAYAAGEFSRFEYRAARREVIENFRPDALGDDDTQRRSAEPSVSANDTRIRASRRPWHWFLMLVLLGVVLIATAKQVQGAVPIAPVSEGNPNLYCVSSVPEVAIRVPEGERERG